ncbi:ASCH domain-containing protein [Kitasatospora sp. MBT66]|uniref:ASCH domain-containing protein n=1 Tax=Kitasatospora sp. MBT66 TaxID=1444769 RepID=UPI0005BD13D3|nr:ASCH domain-containing protein [Kitasatospora sp. MBT66]
MWPRVNGMRSMELGTPGGIRAELNSLVLAGRKTATTGLLALYAEESEELELPGERLALVDDGGGFVAEIEITGVEVTTFGAVTWEHARAEGEGDASLAEWREGHRGYWRRLGTPVEDGTAVVCLAFRLVGTA